MKKHTRSVFALLLVALMVVGMMPFGAFATDTGTDTAEVIEEPIEPEVPLSEEPTEHDITEPVGESDIEVPEEIQLATRYSAGGNITVYNYFHAFFVISEMNCIDGSPFLTSKSSWPGNDPYHGMSAEKFLWVWLRSELLEPKQLRCQPTNLYYEILKKEETGK